MSKFAILCSDSESESDAEYEIIEDKPAAKIIEEKPAKIIESKLQQEKEKEKDKEEEFITVKKNIKRVENNSVPQIPRSIYNPDSGIDYGNTHYLNSSWTVWAHDSEICNDSKKWTEQSYKYICTIDTIGSFWRFFNNFHLLDKYKYYYYIMRNQIKPIWEDNYNRNGGICSIKVNNFDLKDILNDSIEVMICMCILIMNDTFVADNMKINGISYSYKNLKSIYFKIWTSDFAYNIVEKLPISFISKIESLLKHTNINPHLGPSVLYKKITPEDEN
jgi:hypothetical protein